MTDRGYLDEGRSAKATLEKIAPNTLASIERRPYLIGGGVVAALLLLVMVSFSIGRRRRPRPTTVATKT